MRALKLVGYIDGGLVALLVVGIVLIALFFDPNRYKGQIENAVAQATGRSFTLQGDLHVTFFPWLAVRLGPAQLGEPPGFGDKPFLSIQEARLGIRLLPLLGGRFEVGDVLLDHPTVNLISDGEGHNNWSDLGGKKETQPSEPSGAKKPIAASLAGFEMVAGTLTYEDRKAGSRTTVHDLNIKTGRVRSGEPFDVKAAFVAEQGKDLTATTHLSANITLNLDAQRYTLKNFDLALDVKGPSYPKDGLPLALRADTFDLDTHEQTLILDALEADIAGAKLTGALSGSKVLDAPVFKGKLNLTQTSLRELMPKLGMSVPVMRDANVLTKASFDAEAALTKNSASLDHLTLKLDDTTATGRLAVTDFKSKALEFDLNVDGIDADRYRAPEPPKSEQPEKKAAVADKPVLLPVDTLRALNLRGQLTVGTAKFAALTFTQLKLGVNAKNGDVRLEPASASMYGGQYRGSVQVDATQAVPRLNMDQHLAGVDFAPLLKDLYKTEKVAGKGTANIKVNGVGRDSVALVKSLAGTLDFNVADGAFLGTDLVYEIRRAQALLKQQPIPERTGPARTPFNALHGSGVIQNGVLSNKDLEIAAPVLKVTGQGTVDLAQQSLNYRLSTSVLKATDDSAAGKDLLGTSIPVTVTGPLSAPSVRPDIEGLVKERAKQEIDKQKEKLEQKLRDKLKGILGG